MNKYKIIVLSLFNLSLFLCVSCAHTYKVNMDLAPGYKENVIKDTELSSEQRSVRFKKGKFVDNRTDAEATKIAMSKDRF